jgi:GNAT superfamily N-acetyltransferase
MTVHNQCVARASDRRLRGRRVGDGSVFDTLPPLGVLREVSPRTALGKAWGRVWSRRLAIELACDLSADPGPLLDLPALDVSFHDPASVPPLRELAGDVRDEDAFTLNALDRTRAARAGELVIARLGTRVAGLHFIHTSAHAAALERVSPQLYGPLDRDEALTEGVFVVPELRGGGIGPAMLRASTAELTRRGFRRALAVIDIENRRSLRAFHAAGFRPLRSARVDAYAFGMRRSRFVTCDEEALRRYALATARDGRPGGVQGDRASAQLPLP